MPYILLLLGLVLAIVGLYRFFLGANAHQIKSMFLSIAAAAVALAALFLTLTGRLPVAIAGLTALWPIAVSYYKSKKLDDGVKASHLPMNEAEAYEVLGLEQGASEDEIKSAHLRLMKKLHPDAAGSDWIAQKINAARDMLIKS